MNYIEKLRADHPDWNEFRLGYEVYDKCPEDFGYPEDCHGDCAHCWEKEYPEVNEDRGENMITVVVPNQSNNQEEPHILDSGERTQFESGAVRDIQEGKGRCDLIPLEVAARLFGDPELASEDYDQNLNDIAKFQLTKNTNYLYYVLRRFAISHFGSIETMLLEVSKHFEEGAKKYGEWNWQLGIPDYRYINSTVRHYMKFRRKDKDERHDRAFCWNLMCCIWEVDYGDESRKSREANANV